MIAARKAAFFTTFPMYRCIKGDALFYLTSTWSNETAEFQSNLHLQVGFIDGYYSNPIAMLIKRNQIKTKKK